MSSSSPTAPQVLPAFLRKDTNQTRRERTSPVAGEVIGQCAICHDFFSVVILRSGEQLYVEETPRLQWKHAGARQFILQHRPGVCNGKVSLFYGSAERLLPEQRAHARNKSRRAKQTAAARA